MPASWARGASSQVRLASLLGDMLLGKQGVAWQGMLHHRYRRCPAVCLMVLWVCWLLSGEGPAGSVGGGSVDHASIMRTGRFITGVLLCLVTH
jgi:hypothetical protein